MADLVGAINNLKKLLQEKAKRKGSRNLTEAVAAQDIESTAKAWEQEWEYKPTSTWATMFKFVPTMFGIAQVGAIVMYVRFGKGSPAGYIYPRVPFKLFYQYMTTKARGGSVYWGKGVPALKEYSVAARVVGGKVKIKGKIGARQVKARGIMFPTRAVSKTKRAATMYRNIPRSVRYYK